MWQKTVDGRCRCWQGHGDFFAQIQAGLIEGKRRAKAVTIGIDVTGNDDGLGVVNELGDGGIGSRHDSMLKKGQAFATANPGACCGGQVWQAAAHERQSHWYVCLRPWRIG